MIKLSKSTRLFKRSYSFSEGTKMANKADPPYTELERDFLDPADLYNYLSNKGISFYAGVPDSLLKDFCAYVTDNTPAKNHVITANEGAAVALASGYHLATGKFPLVYLQNSGECYLTYFSYFNTIYIFRARKYCQPDYVTGSLTSL